MIMLPRDIIKNLNRIIEDNTEDETQTVTIEFIEVETDDDFFIYAKRH